ncbi:MAG TPA: hypothetical protein IAB49_03270 [Candidatus Caccenecus avistercoris]|nr:hypothetical protein [Candidatus Caccenecus avistercoris]
MQIYKSFLRKPTTKIYIILITLFLLGIWLIKGINENYHNLLQQEYENSYLSIILNKNNFSEIEKIKEIEVIEENLAIETNNEFLILKIDTTLKDNEVVLSPFLKEKINNDILMINDNSFFIKESENILYNVGYISKKSYNLLKEENSSREYKLTLENWLNKEKVINKLQKNTSLNEKYGIIESIEKIPNSNLVTIIYTLNAIILCILIIFIILYVITLINIFNDDKNFNQILYRLGYNKQKLFLLNNIKILVIFCLSLIFSLMLYNISKIYLNMININIKLESIYILQLVILFQFINLIYNIIYLRKRRKIC